jgi:hypothetical protein
MRNRNLIIHWSKKPLFPTLFPKYKTTYKTKPERIKAAGYAIIYTKIKLRSKKVTNGFRTMDAIHRKAVKVDGQWEKNHIPKAVKEESYEIYYNPEENLFVSNIENNIACDAIKQLNGKFKLSKFKLSIVKAIVNFDKLSKSAINITSVFFQMREPVKHIKQITITGDNLGNSSDFKKFASKCDIKSINTNILFNNEELKVSISENSWIHFFENYPLNICLDFIVHLKKEGVINHP